MGLLNSGGKITNSGVEHFASGGANESKDTIPAMLSPGEFVINPEIYTFSDQLKKMYENMDSSGRMTMLDTLNSLQGVESKYRAGVFASKMGLSEQEAGSILAGSSMQNGDLRTSYLSNQLNSLSEYQQQQVYKRDLQELNTYRKERDQFDSESSAVNRINQRLQDGETLLNTLNSTEGITDRIINKLMMLLKDSNLGIN
jgi:hypothetical protein